MGYYAHLLKGDPFTITNPTAVLNRLAETEGKHGHSWCNMVADYRCLAGSDSIALTEMLENFGFHHAPCDNPNHVCVTGFGDSKLGGSWDYFWQAFTVGTTDEVCWIMMGEDNGVWAENISHANGHESLAVTVRYEVK